MIDIHALPCMCCQIEGIKQPFRTEAHHITDKGYRKHSGGDESRLPLCIWHHRGICSDGKTSSKMLFEFGPSLDLNKSLFVKTYGTERELLARLEDPDIPFDDDIPFGFLLPIGLGSADAIQAMLQMSSGIVA